MAWEVFFLMDDIIDDALEGTCNWCGSPGIFPECVKLDCEFPILCEHGESIARYIVLVGLRSFTLS